MIEKSTLRELVVETLQKTPRTQVTSIQNAVEKLVTERNLFPTKEECEAKGVNYNDYATNSLSKADNAIIIEITWDLIMERVLTPGDEQSNYNFPLVSLTKFGEAYTKEASPHYYDANRYAAFLESEDYTEVSIKRFAAVLGIAPGIVVGRLQHDGHIEPNRCNSLKVRLKWVESPEG